MEPLGSCRWQKSPKSDATSAKCSTAPHLLGDSIGNSGGILCIWDPNSFRKDSVTVSDYFVIVRGLEEVPLGGSAYTWCHKSASKMSKLDRFLVPLG
ncbi:hypothetical protein Tco_1151881 [Tanacetum coccineum]